jgi:MFS family permease
VNPRDYIARLPLTDRVTFVRDMQSSVLYGVFSGLALPLITIVARRIGMSAAGITLMVTMPYVGSLFGIFFGHLADTRAAMPLVAVPTCIARASIFLLAFVRTPAGYLAAVSVFYLLSNVTGPAYSSIMLTNYSNANRSRLMSNTRVMVVAVSTLFSAAAGMVLARDERAVHWMFAVASACGVASTLVFSRIRVRRRPAAQGTAPVSFLRAMRVVRKDAPFMVFMAIYFLCAAPSKFTISLEPIWMVDTLRVGYGDASLLLGSAVSLASIAGYLLWGRALKRLGSITILSCVGFTLAARFAALALARSSAGLLPMGILSGISNAGWDLVPIFAIMTLADPANFSLYFGVHVTLRGVRGLVGPTIGAALYESGALPMQGIFWAVSILVALAAAAMLVFSRRVREHAH